MPDTTSRNPGQRIVAAPSAHPSLAPQPLAVVALIEEAAAAIG